MILKLRTLLIVILVLVNVCCAQKLVGNKNGHWSGYQHYPRDEDVAIQKQNDKFLKNVNQVSFIYCLLYLNSAKQSLQNGLYLHLFFTTKHCMFVLVQHKWDQYDLDLPRTDLLGIWI